jgi:hypothetical protein
MNEYVVRAYQRRDEIELVGLFNEAYRAYAGFVPRTVEYWRWSCLDRPDVENEGIAIVVHGGKIVAYAVVGRSGNIWELCFDRAHDGEVLVSLILEKAVEYLTLVGSDAVTLNLPCQDYVAREACEKLGFSELSPDPEIVFVSVLDFERFVRLLSSANKEKLMSFEEDFLIKFRDARSWMNPVLSVRVQNGRIEIGSEDKHCNVIIETDTSTLTSMLFGTDKPLWALLRFKLRIHPLRRLWRVFRLFSLLHVNDPWFVPRADLG